MSKIPCEKCGSRDRANCNCGWTSDHESLTFAEAMALDPSEVEVQSCQLTWLLMSGDPLLWTVAHLRKSKFRRARPKRSLVQEMASTAEYEFATGDRHRADYTLDVLTKCIRAVCEYLPAAIMESRKQECELTVVGAVNRRFLEPR